MLILVSCKATKSGAGKKENYISKASIAFDLEFSSDDPIMQSQFAMMEGSEVTITFSENSMRTEMKIGSIMGNTSIINGAEEKGLVLISGMLGNKAVPLSKEDFSLVETPAPNFDVEKTEETKEILGYPCKKVTLTSEEGDVMEMWVTEKIQSERKDGRFVVEDVDGFPLKLVLNQEGMTLKLTAKSMETKFKDKEMFDVSVPEGYEITTMDAIQGF